jgi:hypothetical protein
MISSFLNDFAGGSCGAAQVTSSVVSALEAQPASQAAAPRSATSRTV